MFKITIEEIKTYATEANGEYGKIEYEYLPVKEYDALPYEEKKAWKKIDGDQFERVVYGYLPKVTKCAEKTTKVYEQIVESFDFAKVISAVNNL